MATSSLQSREFWKLPWQFVKKMRCTPQEGLGVRGLGQPLGLGMWIQGPKVRVLRSELGCKLWGCV